MFSVVEDIGLLSEWFSGKPECFQCDRDAWDTKHVAGFSTVLTILTHSFKSDFSCESVEMGLLVKTKVGAH